MPWYRTEGTPIQDTTGYKFRGKLRPYKNNVRYTKLLIPLSDEEFALGMKAGLFLKPKHRGLVALYFYTGIRRCEAIRATKEQFKLDAEKKLIVFDVGKRLKHGKITPPLVIPAMAPFARYIWLSVEHTEKGCRVWPYHSTTAYNIVHRVFKYPHFFRLSRITNFFNEGWTIAQVKNWTGLTLAALDYYVGVVDVQKMGESLDKAATH